MKENERMKILKLDNFNYEKFLKEVRMEESNSLAWLDNYKPNDNYKFPPVEIPDKRLKNINTGSINDYELKMPLKKALLKRKSSRINGLNENWSIKELLKLLEIGTGLRGDNRWLIKEPTRKVQFRTYPSGGSMYPVKIYVCINNIKGVDPAFYKFYPSSHSLVKVSNNISSNDYNNLFPMSKYKLDKDNSEVSESAFSIFFVTNFSYSFPKYGNLSYRLGLIEAGHIAQNLLLVSTSMKKKSLPVCGIFSDEISQYLQLTKEDFVQYGVIFG